MTDQFVNRTETPLLTVKGLAKHYPIRRGVFNRTVGQVKAADGVDLEIYTGECLGLVGESGSGKTTVGRCVMRAIKPTAGTIRFHDSDGEVDVTAADGPALRTLRRKMQMIFQDPFSSLNPRLTVAELIGEPLHANGLGNRSQRKQRAAELLEQVGLSASHLDRYPHAFSGGQRQRIGIARALALRPSLIVADEPVSALDLSVQAQVLNLLQQLKAQYRLTYLFIAHDLSVVRHLCDRVAVMYQGRVVEQAVTEVLFTQPQHPYTQRLLDAVPAPDPHQRKRRRPAPQ